MMGGLASIGGTLAALPMGGGMSLGGTLAKGIIGGGGGTPWVNPDNGRVWGGY